MIHDFFYPIQLVTVEGSLTLGRPGRVFPFPGIFFELKAEKRISPVRGDDRGYELWEAGIHVERNLCAVKASKPKAEQADKSVHSCGFQIHEALVPSCFKGPWNPHPP